MEQRCRASPMNEPTRYLTCCNAVIVAVWEHIPGGSVESMPVRYILSVVRFANERPQEDGSVPSSLPPVMVREPNNGMSPHTALSVPVMGHPANRCLSE